MRIRRSAALILATTLVAVAFGGQSALAAHGKPFIAKKGTVTIAFNPAFLATLNGLGMLFNNGNGQTLPTTATFPPLSIAAAADQPSRAPRTPLNTAKPAGIVYIGTAEVAFYQQLRTSNTQGGIEFPEVNLGAHPALEGVYSYSHTESEDVNGSTLTPLFLLNVSHVKPVLKGSSLTLKNIPMTLAPAAMPFFNLFGAGFTAGEAVGTLTIKALR